jgi:predicted TIM-barrel enzyme
LIRRARAKDIFTVAWAMSPEEAHAMAEAGADVIGAMIGVTTGGMSGESQVITLDDAVVAVQAMIEAARIVNPEVLVLTHGGPLLMLKPPSIQLRIPVQQAMLRDPAGKEFPPKKQLWKLPGNISR